MLQAIVFDFDGVLVDSEPLHFEAFREVARGLGMDFDYQQYLAELIGFDDRDAFAHILRHWPGAAATAGNGGQASNATHAPDRIDALREQKKQAFEQRVRRGIEPIPGAMELVDAAADRMPIAIASGATMSDITLILDELGRRDTFEVIVSADHVARSKPDPESYALAVRRLTERHAALALEPGACLAIEDTVAGLASARAAGLRTLGLATSSAADTLDGAERVVEGLEGVTIDALCEWFG